MKKVKTCEQEYTLEELIGKEPDWRHCAPAGPMGTRVVCLCGHIGTRRPRVRPAKLCPDCVRINGGPW